MYEQYGRPYYPTPMDQLAQLRQQSMQPQYMPQMQNGMIWVKDFEEADRTQVPPGVPMWNRTNPIVYQKEVDYTGKLKTIGFRLVRETEEQEKEPEFVTWEKFNELMGNVSALANYVKSLNKEDTNNV